MSNLDLKRRSFLLGLGAALAAPAIVKAGMIMPVKKLEIPQNQFLAHDVISQFLLFDGVYYKVRAKVGEIWYDTDDDQIKSYVKFNSIPEVKFLGTIPHG